MNIIHFIRLCLKNWLILLASPLILFAIVYYLTRNEPKTYVSKTTVYTGIATGSSFVSLEESKLDLFGSRAAFDNLINIIESQTTAEEVGLRLLALHLSLEKPSEEVISAESYNKLMTIVPLDVKNLAVKNNENETYKHLLEYKNRNHTNFIYELIHFNHQHYSFRKILGKFKVNRIQSSDLIELSYSDNDPGICVYTLKYFNEVFIRNYSEIKANQSDAVVRYFQVQLDVAKEKLDNAENELLEFNKTNSIINYYEQTEHITSEKERFNLLYLDIRMRNAGAKSVLVILENKLTAHDKKIVNSRDITTLRQKLADVKLQIAMKTYESQLSTDTEDQLIQEIGELQMQAYNLQEEMKELVSQHYLMDNSTEGLPSNSVLNDWLIKVIEFESTNAELLVAEQQQNEYLKLYRQYAPLGANMKRLERKIDVAEREYLSILHSLGLAKLKQQNIELNSNLKVSSEPFYPVKSEPGKRKYLLLIALILGFLIPLFFITAIEFLNPNIRTVNRAAEYSGLKVISVIPDLKHRKKQIDYNYLISRTFAITAQKMSSYLFNLNSRPFISIVLSNFDGEGKSHTISGISEKLKEFEYKVLVLSHNSDHNATNSEIRNYRINSNFPIIDEFSNLFTGSDEENLKNFDFVFIEIPGVIHHPAPHKLLKKADNLIIVTRADRPWVNADDLSVSNLIENAGQDKLVMVLNNINIDELENVLGELPGKKTFVRQFAKRFFTTVFG